VVTITYLNWSEFMANVKMVDIAKAAGVSLATVGRVIHNNGYVAEDKRALIEQMIKDMGYVPNKMAQALKYSQSRLIGHMTLFNQNMLYEQISSAVDAAAVKRGYNVLTLASHRNKGEEAKQIEELIGHRAEGIIITSNTNIEPELVQRLVDNKIPVVMIERALELPLVDRLLVDDFNGAYEAVTRIIQKKHRSIGFIGQMLLHEVERNRYIGYCTALKDNGLFIKPEHIILNEDYTIASGYSAIKSLMELENPPTAVFMTSDIYGCGAMQYLYENNIRVPKDLSLVGYDNTLSTMMAPPLNSVGLPYSEIGEFALDLLLTRIENPKCEGRKVSIKTEYIDRDTVIQRG
jgi:DNA-binding LacI/PurR family transcriptional regulator